MQQRSSPQTGGKKRLRQQQLQLGRSSGGQSGDGGKTQQRFWPCPVCSRSFTFFRLEDHVNQCLDNSPSPKTTRSLPLSNGDEACKISGEELLRAAPIQRKDDDVCDRLDAAISPSSNSVSLLKSSGLQGPCPSGQQGVISLPTERCAFLEANIMRPSAENVAELVHLSSLQRSLERQQDVNCLPAEDCLSLEGRLLQQPNEAVEDGGTGEFSVKEYRGKEQPRCTLESSADNNGSEFGTSNITIESSSSGGDAEDSDGLDNEGIVEDRRNGNGPAMDLPPAGFKLLQRQAQSQARLSMFRNFSSAPLQRKPSVTVLQPGMVLFRSWLDLDTQQRFVEESQGVAHLFRRPTTAGGGKYHVYSMSWGPKYDAKTHRYVSKGSKQPIPSWMFELAQTLARDAHQHTPVYPQDSIYTPDVELVNFYPVKADELGVVGLGGHQDLDDSGLMPVVSVSVGDSMTFFYRRLPPFSRRKSGVSISVDEEAARSCEDGDAAHNREHKILLNSGDVLVFGGKSRLVYHGTRHVQPGTRPSGLHMVPGRLNFTFRQTVGKSFTSMEN